MRSIVVLGADAVEPVRLNGAAAAVFAALDQPRSEPELLAALCDTGADQAGIADALDMLCRAHLVSPGARDAW